MTGIEALRQQFADRVDPDGRLPPAWRAALAETPRDLFVPWFSVPQPDRPGWRLVEQSDEWAAGVFANRPLITQVGGSDDAVAAARAGSPVTGWATSSSSQPSLMILMLAALGVEAGTRVLEIGTGTGYNAALLSRLVGARGVTTVDVDGDVVDRARQRLTAVGHEPEVVTADGHGGFPARAPLRRRARHRGAGTRPAVVDRAVPRRRNDPPAARHPQRRRPARPADRPRRNGRGPFPAGLRRLHARAHGVPERRGARRAEQRRRAPTSRPPDRPRAPGGERRGAPLRVLPPPRHRRLRRDDTRARQRCPAADLVRDDRRLLGLPHDEGGAGWVREGGPRPFWSRVEQVHALWTSLGSPARERMGLTVRGALHTIWLDDPEGPRRWDRPFD